MFYTSSSAKTTRADHLKSNQQLSTIILGMDYAIFVLALASEPVAFLFSGKTQYFHPIKCL